MDKIDFDSLICRDGTHSVKHDGSGAYFGTRDIVPMWVADMDFASPEPVVRALQRRAAHEVYGYTFYPDSLFDALTDWLKQRHGWIVPREWIVMAPGVVPTLYAAVNALSNEGEAVVVQSPVYPPFLSAVTQNGRLLVENSLHQVSSDYQIDFEHLQQCASAGAKLLLFCSPHNPVGRVWSKNELQELLRIARQHNMIILSDEIHSDLVYPGESHTPLALLAGPEDQVITALAPSKSFNIPGLGLSCLIAENAAHRRAIRKVFDSLHIANYNPFSIAAFEAAYRSGGDWLDALMIYLKGNRDFALDYISQHLYGIQAVPPQGTYLLWLDCRGMQMDDAALRDFFIHQARVGMNPGITFGEAGQGFMRLNLATPKAVLEMALERIAAALRAR